MNVIAWGIGSWKSGSLISQYNYKTMCTNEL